ncbi:MAG: hypothetical protein IH876_04965, partial [Gemmatimonadetes bacterium]|nr:hypothetical protein [Gemmatimonadota bacterium]
MADRWSLAAGSGGWGGSGIRAGILGWGWRVLDASTRMNPTPSTTAAADVDWNAMLAPYKEPSLWRSVYQLVNTATPFFVMWYIMFRTLDRGY